MSSIHKDIIAELEWRGALGKGKKDELLAALAGERGNPLAALLERGVDPDELLQAAASAAGLTAAPKRLLVEPAPTRLDAAACIAEGGVPIGERQGAPLVAFCDPERVLDAAVALPPHQALLALPRDHEQARMKVLAALDDFHPTQPVDHDEDDGATIVVSQLPPGMLEALRADRQAPSAEPRAAAKHAEMQEAPTIAVSALSEGHGPSWLPDNSVLAAAAQADDRDRASVDPASRPPVITNDDSAWAHRATEALDGDDFAESTIVATAENLPPEFQAMAQPADDISELDTSALHVDTSVHTPLSADALPTPPPDAATVQSQPYGAPERDRTGDVKPVTDGATIQSEPYGRPVAAPVAAPPQASEPATSALAQAVSDEVPASEPSEAPTERVESVSDDAMSEVAETALKGIPRYAVERVLGRGGMATVHLATDKETGGKVAVKILEAHLAEDAIFIERFRREVASTQSLEHENIIRLFDAGESGETYYMVTEFVDGGTLSELLRATGPLPVALVVPLLDMALAGLHYAHQTGTIHRDLKPANLMLTKRGVLKIADFGIAKTSNDETLTQTGTLFGTPAYMSPEQAMGRHLDHRSDLFSIGIVFYQLLTGLNPFHSENPSTSLYKIANGRFPPLFSIMPWAPLALEQVIMRLLEVERDKRFIDGQAARRELAGLRDALRREHPGVGERALDDPRPVAAELRALAAERQVMHAKAQLEFDPPREQEAAFRFYLAGRLDSANYDAINHIADMRAQHGFRFEAEPDQRINEVHKALKDNKPTPALLRRAHDLHAAQKDLFGMARFGRQYLRMMPHDAHMKLLAHKIVGDDLIAPYSPPPKMAPTFSASSDDIVPGLNPAGSGPGIRAAATPGQPRGSVASSPTPEIAGPHGMADAVADMPFDDDDVSVLTPGADPERMPTVPEDDPRDAKAGEPVDSLEEMKLFLKQAWEEIVRSLTGDQGVEGLKQWWHDRFNKENKDELRQQAQALLGQGKQALAQSKEALLAEENRAKLEAASQSFWQRHRRMIMLGAALMVMLWLLKLGCGLAIDVLRDDVHIGSMGSESAKESE